jgi:TetR/AcrR family transcriptional regulator of autoinduction and epiphytic fitness
VVAPGSRRRYQSTRREEQARQTRARVLTAATQQFLAAGYPGTTMKAVAAAAGVSVPTVETAFGTKAKLLKAAIDVATAGDDAPEAMLDRSWVDRAQAHADADGFVAEFAAALTTSAQRAAGLILAALDAAPLDPEISTVAAQMAAQREVMAAWLVDGVARRGSLREELSRAEAVDTVWLLMDPAVFSRLTGPRGWPPDRFQAWFGRSVLRLLQSG